MAENLGLFGGGQSPGKMKLLREVTTDSVYCTVQSIVIHFWSVVSRCLINFTHYLPPM